MYLDCNVLIIDEVSMVSKKMFDTAENVCRSVRKNENYFGGMQLILSGDFYQPWTFILPFLTNTTDEDYLFFNMLIHKIRELEKKVREKSIQGMPQSQTAALPRPQEEEEPDKSKQAQTEQTYEKH